MSSLYASRWADSPVDEEKVSTAEPSSLSKSGPESPRQDGEKAVEESPGLQGSRWADPTSPSAKKQSAEMRKQPVEQANAPVLPVDQLQPESAGLKMSRWADTPPSEEEYLWRQKQVQSDKGVVGVNGLSVSSAEPTSAIAGESLSMEQPLVKANNGEERQEQKIDEVKDEEPEVSTGVDDKRDSVAGQVEGQEVSASMENQRDGFASAAEARDSPAEANNKQDSVAGAAEDEKVDDSEATEAVATETTAEMTADTSPTEDEALSESKQVESEVDQAERSETPLPVSVVNEEPQTLASEDYLEPAKGLTGEDSAPVPPSPMKLRPEPPRFRKKLSWRGKNCVICIPRLDYHALGLVQPLSTADVQARLKQFEVDGYDTSGFDLQAPIENDDGPVHAKPIYPEETETQHLPSNTGPNVKLPDLKQWADYMDWLTEQKLAALGVSMGAEEPAPASAAAQDMSRQSSAQYPPLPFSPPISSASGASMGRPGLTRGHSATMSVASPISPLNGPFGHMHRHSSLSGGPFAFASLQQQSQSPTVAGLRAFSPSAQQSLQQSAVPGMQSFSPLMQNQFSMPGMERALSPPQVTAFRSLYGSAHGSGSPLSQEILSQDKGFGLISNVFGSHGNSTQPTPMLPQLPEEDDEDELLEPEEPEEPDSTPKPEPPAYVPPHKRAQLNANISAPTPRGHHHNISEGLEREILEAEKRQITDKRDRVEVEDDNGDSEATVNSNKKTKPEPEKDPLGSSIVVREALHSRKKSSARFNVSAPAFSFNPTASFQPGSTSFTFTSTAPAKVPVEEPATAKTNPQFIFGHGRQKSSGSFNAAAPAFHPTNLFKATVPSNVPTTDFDFSVKAKATVAPSLPTSDFDFTAPAPFKANVSLDEQPKPAGEEVTGIFGKFKIPDIIKPSRRSKAIAIVRPDDSQTSAQVSATEHEDSEGRIAQGDDRMKRQRKIGDDGDEVPQFAEPTSMLLPEDFILPSNNTPKQEPSAPANVEDIEKEVDEALDSIAEKGAETIEDVVIHDHDRLQSSVPNEKSKDHHHKKSSSLSALAKPFQMPGSIDSTKLTVHAPQDSFASISELEEGEFREDGQNLEPPQVWHTGTTPTPPVLPEFTFQSQPSEKIGDFGEPSFDEIDAVMRQINEAEEAGTGHRRAVSLQDRSISPLPMPSPRVQTLQGVNYLGAWSRSDAPSPTPARHRQAFTELANPSYFPKPHTETEEPSINDWPPINRLNKAADAPTSDWSDMLSPPDEAKFEQRSTFFDSHIEDLIGRTLNSRLAPLEETLRDIHTSVNKQPVAREPAAREQGPKLRSPSAIESDADDEDEHSEGQRQRPISRGRDKRIDQIKTVVLEALREQSSSRLQPTQQAYDLQEFHSALADMKVSFARAASTSLELDDVRAVLEEVISKQPRNPTPIISDESDKNKEASHKRELSELEGRLNETLAAALEEANLRRQTEEREAEIRRLLRLNEEELQLLRLTAQDNESRINASEHDHEDILARLEKAEAAALAKDQQLKDLEEESAATLALLEESRTSVNTSRLDNEDMSERLQKSEAVSMAKDQQIKDLESECAAALATLEEYRVSTSTSKQEREDLSERLQKAEAASLAKDQKIQELEGESAATQATFGEYRVSMDTSKHDYDDLSARLEKAETVSRAKDQQIKDLEYESAAALATLDEYRTSSHKWRQDHEHDSRQREEMEAVIAGLRRQLEESDDSVGNMRRRLEKLHSDMAHAAGQLASEKSTWKQKEEHYRNRCEELKAHKTLYLKERSELHDELSALRAGASEVADARLMLNHMKTSNTSLGDMIRKLQTDLSEQQSIAARFERDFRDARDAGRIEIQRTRMAMETDIEAANHQVNIVRAELEGELSKVRCELDNVKMEAETTKARYERLLEEEDDVRREALRKVNHTNSVALDEARQKYEMNVQEYKATHARALAHAREDKDRSEYILNERLSLADAKLQHYQDKVLHLEERLEITKSAAQAAAMNAQSRSAPGHSIVSGIPEKVSPQALRESILVLQEQLQERESRLEKLQTKVDKEAPAKLKARDDEIAWLRELLAVRSDELTGLINTLSRPTFDRDAVRDAAIRIRTNLQMEQQEKERFGHSSPNISGQAIASLSNFASPKAVSLSSAFNKWRANMESSALKNAPQSSTRSASARRIDAAPFSNTPSKAPTSSAIPSGYLSGLMTPPATNLRNTPSPEVAASLPAPRMQSQLDSKAPHSEPAKPRNRVPSTGSDAAALPLFRPQNYDEDAEDNKIGLEELEEDEDLDDVADSQPPAFRSLEEEMEDSIAMEDDST